MALYVLPTPGQAEPAVSRRSEDLTATRRYLQAEDAYARAWRASLPSARAAVGALTRQLDGECHGVAAGAAGEAQPFLSKGRLLPSPRLRGEANRRVRQRGELEAEVGMALEAPLFGPSRQAALNFARAVMSLRWTGAGFTKARHTEMTLLAWAIGGPAPDLCADLRAWAASGFTTLAPATRALSEELSKRSAALWTAIRGEGSFSLSGFENGSERALSVKIDRGARARRQVEDGARARLEVALGLINSQEAEELEETGREGPPRGAVVIERGRTVAGGHFTISVLPKRLDEKEAAGCSFGLRVEETLRGAGIGARSRSLSSTCAFRAHLGRPRVECSAGMLTVEAQLPAGVRRARLILSDGRSVASRVALVPPRLGGPAGFYYQALRGPAPYPVALAELGRRGGLIRTARLPRRAHCARQQSTPKTRRPAGGSQTIVKARVPDGGPRFSIVGERQPYRHRLSVEVEHIGLGSPASVLGAFPAGGEGMSVPEDPAPHAPSLAAQVYPGCQPHQYAIVYGVLRDGGDRALARTSAGLIPLRRVKMPASLHVSGELVYGVLPAVPSQILLQTPGGKTTLVMTPAHRVTEAREMCEGEAEPGRG